MVQREVLGFWIKFVLHSNFSLGFQCPTCILCQLSGGPPLLTSPCFMEC